MPDMGTELDLTEVVSVAGEAALMFTAAGEAGASSGRLLWLWCAWGSRLRGEMTNHSSDVGGGFGWRAWTVDQDAAGPVLASPRSAKGTPWRWSTVPVAARCTSPGHEPPEARCSCGIAVAPSLPAMLEWLCGFARRTQSVPHVVGKVRFCGPVLHEYDEGVRHLRVASCEPVDVLVTVRDAEPYADALAARYGLKVIVGRYSDNRWVLDDLSHLVGFWQDGDRVTLPDPAVTRLGVRAA